ncbi:transporter substrate-binding protein [Streptomyces sp. NBC_00322]|uniref:urea ABC transporter substrate-binding protein n=1 Tax=Streptomyces sp. NBC_00322 TaxID=2975712 RepID=UPI002E282820|nr:ABC transporter substrate-binding protein [Streptomyces sp. NBC_00322]
MRFPERQLALRNVAVASSMVLLTAACGPSSADDTGSGSNGPIIVGSILDATGPLNVYGKPKIDATNLAIKDINAHGGVLGRKLKLISYDSQSDNAKYVQYANKLTLEDNVSVIMGGITSASREAIRPIVDRAKTLYFYNTIYEGGVCDRNVFSTGAVPSQQLAPLIPFAAKNYGKKIYIVAADYNFGEISADWAKRYAAEADALVVGLDFVKLESAGFGAVINRLQAAKPDVVVSLLVGGNHYAFYRDFASTGLNKSMKIVSSTFGVENMVLAPRESKGTTVAYPYFQELDSPASAAFLRAWREEYGKNYQYVPDIAVLEWNGWHLWAAAVNKAKSLDRDKVIASLESGLSINSPSGKVTMNGGSHHVSQNISIAEANGKHGYKVLTTAADVAPAYENSVCDLRKNPTTNEQFTP